MFWPGGRWDLSSSAKCTSWAGRQSLNHWTAREVLIHISIGTMLCWLAVYTQTGNRLNLTYSLPISACSLGSFQTSKAPWHLLSYLCFIITWEVQFGTIPLYYGWSSLNFYKKKKKKEEEEEASWGNTAGTCWIQNLYFLTSHPFQFRAYTKLCFLWFAKENSQTNNVPRLYWS